MSDLHPSHEPYAADELLVRVKLTEPLFPDEEGDLWWLELSEGVESAELVDSNAVEHETALDHLVGEVEGAVSVLHGESDEVRSLAGVNFGARIAIADQLDYQAGELDNAVERFLDQIAPREREISLT